MQWKNTLVDSRDGVSDFLRSGIAEVVQEPFTMRNLTENDRFVYEPYIRIKSRQWVGDEGLDPNLIMYFKYVGRYDHGSLIDGVTIGPKFKGHGLGSIATKAFLGLAHHFSSDQFIELAYINKDGPGFWPYATGAMPSLPPVTLSKDIDELLERDDAKLSVLDKTKITALRPIANDNPFAAWRILSQLNLSTDGKQTRHEIFARTCATKSLFIFPGEPGTRKILRKHLGVLPPFRPLQRNSRLVLPDDQAYAPIGHALAQASNLQFRYQL